MSHVELITSHKTFSAAAMGCNRSKSSSINIWAVNHDTDWKIHQVILYMQPMSRMIQSIHCPPVQTIPVYSSEFLVSRVSETVRDIPDALVLTPADLSSAALPASGKD